MGISSGRGLERLAVNVHNTEDCFGDRLLPDHGFLWLFEIGPRFSFPQCG